MTNLHPHALPERPNLDHLRGQAKDLLHAFRSSDPAAVAEVHAHFRPAPNAAFALHDAQLVIARRYGFDSWPKLKAFVDGVTVKRLAEAVQRGDLQQVKEMLDARPELVNFDMAENNEHRAIHYAVFRRDADMVRLLMRSGADARKGIYPHRQATSALTIAQERGYEEIVTLIREEEQARAARMSGVALPEGQSADALIEAIVSGDKDEVIAKLEAAPALIVSCSREGWTPLHAAAYARSERLVEWLLRRGADPNRSGPHGWTALDAAAAKPRDTAFQAVAGLLKAGGAAMTARAAAALGDLDWLTAEQVEGALQNPVTDKGGLLTVAVLHDQKAVLELLLGLGFDPNERARLEGIDEAFYSQAMPLWNCAALNKFEMAEILLRYGANPNVPVYASGSPVYSAYSRKNWEMVALLKRHGGIVDPVTAGLFHDREQARELLAQEAAGKQFPPGLLEGGNVSEDLLRGAADGGDGEIVRMALPGVDWAPDDERWYWIQMQAIWGGHIECLRLILERSAANLRHPRFARTLLHDVAALGGADQDGARPAMAALLLDGGASLAERDAVLRSTPLGWASRWGRAALVRFLLDRGADPEEPEAEPWARPRVWAGKMGHIHVLAVLNGRIS